MKEIKVDGSYEGTTLLKALQKILPEAPNSFFYKMLRKKNIVLNGKKATGNEKLKSNDSIKIFVSDDTFALFSKTMEDKRADNDKFNTYKSLDLKDFDVIYETKDYLMINKPVGLLSQKAKPTDISANELLLGYLIQQKKMDFDSYESFKPSICNRLDRNTSGILICAKTLNGAITMADALKHRNIQKYYVCLVKGKVSEAITVDAYIKKDESTNKVTVSLEEKEDYQRIVTSYEPLQSNDKYTLLKVHLITGKTHQIRAHLSFLGHPLIGDYKYGDRKTNDYFAVNYQLKSQLLHARELILEDGTTVFAPLPQNFDIILKDIFR